MSTLAEIEAAADALPIEQKQELLLFLTSRLRSSQIKKTPGVCGGAAGVGDTRIAVWTLVQLKKLGRSESQLLGDFPSLVQGDLDAVWHYYRENPAEIDEAIAAEESPWV
jgi:uncharacterized protein (DUF433 family)